MRRFLFLLTLLGVTLLAGSAGAQDTTAKRDSARRDSLQRAHQRIPETSRGDVDTSRHKPPALVDTAKIRAPSRRDSALVRQEIRSDTASVARDTAVRDTTHRRPKPDSLPKKPPPLRG